MVVCHCLAVNDRTILGLIADGALDPDALTASCGAGARCGGCRPTLEALIARETAVTLGASQPAA